MANNSLNPSSIGKPLNSRYHFFFNYLFCRGHENANAINCFQHKVRKFAPVSRCKWGREGRAESFKGFKNLLENI